MKYQRQKNQRLGKKVKSLPSIVASLRTDNLVSETCAAHLENITSGVPLEVLKRMQRNNSEKLRREACHPELVKFALTLQFYSTEAYEYVRKHFNLALPHVATIRRWYSAIDGNPGFTQEAFDSLKVKVADANEKGEDIVCSLMLDEMSIMRHLDFDGKRVVGYVDVGTHVDDDSLPEATEALVVLVVCLNGSWKVPIAYFVIHGLSGVERANIVKQCLEKLHEVGVKEVGLICDGPSCHMSMLNEFGAKMHMDELRTHLNHPSNPSQNVYVLLDICHMLKLVRNSFATCTVIKDSRGDLVQWQFIDELHKLQTREGLHMANKLRKTHMQWQAQKMKVNIAAQTLSSSVADAIDFCRQELQLDQFKDSEATTRFIRMVDRLFDMFNSRNPFCCNCKAPLRVSNKLFWTQFLEEAYLYIEGLRDINGGLICSGRKNTGFLGFLCAIRSVRGIFQDLVACNNAKRKYLLTYKLSQDHIELFFAAIRSSYGCNNNPTALQFRSAYKRMLVRHEISSSSGNCRVLDFCP